jgi:hypothetical protein
MAIGIDQEPTDACIANVAALKGIKEAIVFKEADTR